MPTEQLDIYRTIGQAVTDGIIGEWTKAVATIEYLPDRKSYQGYFLALDGKKEQLEINPPFELDDMLDEFHLTTTEGGDNKWNHLRYTLYPDNSFEVDFIWDEDRAEVMAYINATAHVPEPQRGAGLDHFKQMQLERKTQRIYDALALALLNNAPRESEWQQLVLTLTQPPLAYEAAIEITSGRPEALLLLGEVEAVEALVELTQAGDHLRWEKAQLFVQPTGAYRFSFEWAGAKEYNLPRLYHREGQIDPPAPSA